LKLCAPHSRDFSLNGGDLKVANKISDFDFSFWGQRPSPAATPPHHATSRLKLSEGLRDIPRPRKAEKLEHLSYLARGKPTILCTSFHDCSDY
jgi:hypothetical protein